MAFRVIRKFEQGSSTGFVRDTLCDAIASAQDCIDEEAPGYITSVEDMDNGTFYTEAEITRLWNISRAA